MGADVLQTWLQRSALASWAIGVAYALLWLVFDVSACLAFGRKQELLGQLWQDPIHLWWLILFPGMVPIGYTLNFRATVSAVSSMRTNGIFVLACRHEVFTCSDAFPQWIALILSLLICLAGLRRRDKSLWFTKLPLPIRLLRLMIMDLPVTYMACKLTIDLIDWALAVNKVFVLLPRFIAVDIWHPDGLYGLKPAYNLLLSQAGIGLIASFLPMLVLHREAGQSYSWMYRTVLVLAVLAVLAFAAASWINLDSALERVKVSAVTTVTKRLRSLPWPPTALLQETRRLNLLIEYQIARAVASTAPIPDLVKGLGISRFLLALIEVYAVLQPVLRLPQLPKALRRMVRAD